MVAFDLPESMSRSSCAVVVIGVRTVMNLRL
jgi:hypothetical protein